MDDYYEKLFALPEELRNIVDTYWDVTGRPVTEHAYIRAAKDVLDLCNDFTEYKTKYAKLFFNLNINEYDVKNRMEQEWYVYTGGMNRIVRDLNKNNKKDTTLEP